MRQSLDQGSADSVPVSSLPSSAPPCVSVHHPRPYPLSTTHYPLSAALCFHNLTNPFSRKPFCFTSIQNPRGVTLRRSFQDALCLSVSVACLPQAGKSHRFSSLQPLVFSCRFFPHSYRLFSAACRLFRQKQGGGGAIIVNHA